MLYFNKVKEKEELKMITAHKARLITQKYYQPLDKKAFYDELEQLIIEESKKGNYKLYYKFDDKIIVTRKDARDIKRYLKQHGFTFIQIEIDSIQTISFNW